MRRLNVCVLGPAALIITAIAIALTPMTSNAAEPVAGSRLPALESSTSASADDATCEISDAAITWGIKESLRSYISGTIANGEWAVSDGATYETPNFGWSTGSGVLDAGEGVIAFDGALRFTGHDGILDTTLSSLELSFDGSTTAHLIFDVSGTTQDGNPVDETGVEFADINIAGIAVTDGRATLNDAPVVLTETGSAAFGTYPAGEALDPITVNFSATESCMPAPKEAVTALARNTAVIVTVGVVVAAGGLVFYVARRRGTKREPTTK
ncbi:HtaA domain-containing protein [Salinibacterium sp. M195]|uniref:HtaA domain-containing protein n=1 Tax=Salinibacterium sp. M195 TaxID=2583374 RepID=UPI001C6276B0|nr:HtaA domain-containing protein [Salinibacterium sp. M195]QYH35534.1 hypothetical protein FFT87_05955 [Salinibacterium sp. M195]